jgi:hypothetical protein
VSPPAYAATAALSVWNDPDGDPLEAAPVATTGPCGQPALVGNTLGVTCTVPYTGVPAANLIEGTWSIAQAVRDPWTTVTYSRDLLVRNRPPLFGFGATSAFGACTTTPTCCEFDMGQCVTREQSWAASSVPSGVWLEDPDGDPLVVTFGGSEVGVPQNATVCLPGDCQFTFAVPMEVGCGSLASASFTATISDGGPPATATHAIGRVCR